MEAPSRVEAPARVHAPTPPQQRHNHPVQRRRWNVQETEYLFSLTREFILTNGFAPVGEPENIELAGQLYERFRGTSIWGNDPYERRVGRLAMFHLQRGPSKNQDRFDAMCEQMLGKGWREKSMKMAKKFRNSGGRRPGVPPKPKHPKDDDEEGGCGLGGGIGGGGGKC